MVNKLSKEAFVKLAEAYSKQENYEKDLRSHLNLITKRYEVYLDLLAFLTHLN